MDHYLPLRKKESFWWRDVLKLLDSFKGMAMINIQDGRTCLFWEDLWNNRVPKLHFPELFSFAKNPKISLRFALDVDGPEQLLHLAISDIALQQLTTLAQELSSLQQSSESDIWSYIWGSPYFSSSKAIGI